MNHITQDALDAMHTSWKLKEESDKLFDKWHKEFEIAKTDSEINATRPLFDKALKAHKKWKKHWNRNSESLQLPKID